MNFRQLEYFITVAETKNISAAARKIHMAQPPLSRQLQLLEDELDTKLFIRGIMEIIIYDNDILTKMALSALYAFYGKMVAWEARGEFMEAFALCDGENVLEEAGDEEENLFIRKIRD